MSQLAVEHVLGRLVTDADFRAEFFVEPAAVCRDQGLELTPVELAALRRVDQQALQTLAGLLDPKIVRAMTLRIENGEPRLVVTRTPRDRRTQRGA